MVAVASPNPKWRSSYYCSYLVIRLHTLAFIFFSFVETEHKLLGTFHVPIELFRKKHQIDSLRQMEALVTKGKNCYEFDGREKAGLRAGMPLFRCLV